MMSLQQIQSMSDEQAERAAQDNLVPYVLFNADDVHSMPGGSRHTTRSYPFPNLGSYVPDGWEEVDRLFVDKMGSPNGGGGGDLGTVGLHAALLELVHQPGSMGIAIVEEGQFQLYLGVFKRIDD